MANGETSGSVFQPEAESPAEVEPTYTVMSDVHRRNGSRPATATEVEEFERLYGPSLPSDGEG